jgi:hypothetical protein
MSRIAGPHTSTARASALAVVLATALAGCERTTPTAEPLPVAGEPVPAAPPLAKTPEPTLEPAPPPEPDHARAATTLVGTVEALGELHARHAEDCVALAGAIERFHAEHGASLAGAAPEVHAHIDADDELRSRMRTAMEPVMTASMACRRDPTFATAQARLFGSAG